MPGPAGLSRGILLGSGMLVYGLEAGTQRVNRPATVAFQFQQVGFGAVPDFGENISGDHYIGRQIV